MTRAIRGRPPTSAAGPLTPDEIERLDDFLRQGGGDVDSFDMLDGFITAVRLIPEPFLPAFWYPNILGGVTDDETEAIVAKAEESGELALLIRHWASVVRRLAVGGPWLPPNADDDEWSEVWWANGVQEGLDRTGDYWEEIPQALQHDGRLPAVKQLLDLVEGANFRTPSHEKRHERLAVQGQAALEINAMYRALRRP